MRKAFFALLPLLASCGGSYTTFNENCPDVAVIAGAAEKSDVRIVGVESACREKKGYDVEMKVKFWAAVSKKGEAVSYFAALVDGKKVLKRYDYALPLRFKKDEAEQYSIQKHTLHVDADLMKAHKNLTILWGLR